MTFVEFEDCMESIETNDIGIIVEPQESNYTTLEVWQLVESLEEVQTNVGWISWNFGYPDWISFRVSLLKSFRYLRWYLYLHISKLWVMVI